MSQRFDTKSAGNPQAPAAVADAIARRPSPAGGFEQQSRALSPRSVQMRANGAPQGDVQSTAAAGVSNGGGSLPYQSELSKSFGPGHDLSGVRAHVGGGASQACSGLGAEAYATGNSVAFKESPSLKLVAHEAAHVVQQRAGVSLSGGVGSVGDKHEQAADAVADRVASGQSAADLLPAGGSKTTAVQSKAVQCYKEKEVGGRDARVSEPGTTALLGRQELYSTPALMTSANAQLAAAGQNGSFITLTAGKNTVKVDSNTLTEVVPKFVDKGSKNGAQQGVADANKKGGKDSTKATGDSLATWTDCGRASSLTTGSQGHGDRKVVYNQGGKEQTSRGMQDPAVSGWLKTEPGNFGNQIYMSLIPGFIADAANSAFLKAGVHYTETGGTRVPVTPKDSVDARRLYSELTEAGRDKFDKQAGTNHYANPDVGESYTMATEGDMPGFKETGSMTWNYHWAGVAMKDGSDNISLENFAATTAYAKSMGVNQRDFIDRDWNFDMYGTVNKDQTFHKHHLDSNTHGNKATSMRVRTDK